MNYTYLWGILHNTYKDQDPNKLTPESLKPRQLEYPFEYFDAQIHFACKWSEITGKPLHQCLLENTALHVRITKEWPSDEPNSKWTEVIEKIGDISDPTKLTEVVFEMYKEQPHSEAKKSQPKPKHFGWFSFDYLENKKTIKMHFIMADRGAKSGLAKEYIGERISDLHRMFTHIKETYPEATTVIGGSWLYNLYAYTRVFPPQYTENMKRLVPPRMSFLGNSLWGQFMDSLGRPQQDRYAQFLSRVAAAQTEEDLVNAFPYYPLQPRCNIEHFFNFYQVN